MGNGDQLWNGQPNKKSQKDIDDRWTEKGIIPQIIEHGVRGKSLTDEQKESNRLKSQVRCLCEHVFGYVTNNMHDFT